MLMSQLCGNLFEKGVRSITLSVHGIGQLLRGRLRGSLNLMGTAAFWFQQLVEVSFGEI